MSKGAGDKLKLLQQQLEAKNNALESVIMANNEAQTEINNLNDEVSGLNAELNEIKEKFEPIRQQNESFQQRYEHNERVVASVRQDF
jgi:peptidoglycan hydrolase CwlO-like protein